VNSLLDASKDPPHPSGRPLKRLRQSLTGRAKHPASYQEGNRFNNDLVFLGGRRESKGKQNAATTTVHNMAIEKGDIRTDTRDESMWAQYGRRHESINNQIFANVFTNALAMFDYRQAKKRLPTLVKMKLLIWY
jgi:hypothetical protein